MHFVAIDHDGDGHATSDCQAKGGAAIELGDDCNDNDAKTYPGAWDGPVGDGHANACDGVDNDCNKSVDDAKLTSGGFCACTPGATRSCAADGKLGTCAGGTETCGADAKWGACSIQPAASDSCLPNNDDDCDGKIREGCPCPGPTPANYQTACGSCGGTVQCDGSCSIPTPGNLGAACNSCGGVIQCNGTCSTSQPGNFGAACGSCGGHVQCDGTCSVPTPGNLGASCGSCGGTIQCNGACSIPTPGNLGAACNSCGGVVQCNGSCSTSQPGNLGQSCGQCGGVVQCNGTCSKDTPGNLGAVQTYSYNQERFSCCFIDYYKTFGGACHAGWNYAGVRVDKISGGGGCDVVAEGGGGDCSVRVHFYNKGTEGAVCNVTVLEQRVCD